MIALKIWGWAVIALLLLAMIGTKQRDTFVSCLVVAVTGLIALWLAS